MTKKYCVACNNNCDKLTELLPQFQTKIIKELCPICLKKTNNYLQELQTQFRREQEQRIKDFIKELGS